MPSRSPLAEIQDSILLSMLDFPQTTKELMERHRREVRDAPGEYQGMPPGLRTDVVFVDPQSFYRRLRKMEEQGLVSGMKLPSHSRSVMWWRPRWTTAAAL